MSTRVKPVSAGVSARAFNRRLRIGSTNATVLPVPVSAQPITSCPVIAIGITALWIGVVISKPRTATPSSSDGSRLNELNGIGAGSYAACGRSVACVLCGAWNCPRPPRGDDGPASDGRREPPRLRRRGRPGWVDSGFKISSASAEGDDAANGIVWRDADGHPISRNHLDPEAAHAAAQLCEDLVALVTLHAVKPAAMDRHHGTLHINQIVLAQMLSFPTIKDCATCHSSV